ncbi:MAG: cell division protein FtsZ [Chloroflexota bacterium]|nr:cell division protein FtsZ [Chloroflexota bacterium]
MNISIDLASQFDNSPRIKVLGLGGAGCNTISRLSFLDIPGVELIAANTDQQCLQANPARSKILLGSNLTRGLGSGGNPAVGRSAAEESHRELIAALSDCDLVFLTAGMGGGTGSGAIEIAARIAKSLDIPSLSIVTVPFSFEAGRRQQNAAEAVASLRPFTDTLITIPNDRLVAVASEDTTLEAAFGLSDDILLKGIQGITQMLGEPGLLDVDFSHVLRLVRSGGGTYISLGYGEGENRAVAALESALTHPLLEDIQVQQAAGLIAKFSGDLSIAELEHAMHYLQARTSPDTEIIPAVNTHERLNGQVMVTLLATGIGATALETAPVMPEIAVAQVHEEKHIQEEAPLAMDFAPHSFEPAEKTIDDLEVPAFIRRGYNQVERAVAYHG